MADDDRRRMIVVVGTRPEAIKMFPVIHALEQSEVVRPFVVTTGQHTDLCDDVLAMDQAEIAAILDQSLECSCRAHVTRRSPGDGGHTCASPECSASRSPYPPPPADLPRPAWLQAIDLAIVDIELCPAPQCIGGGVGCQGRYLWSNVTWNRTSGAFRGDVNVFVPFKIRVTP